MDIDIILTTEPRQPAFMDVAIGDVCQAEGTLFMRIKESKCHHNALNLETHTTTRVAESIAIEHCDAVLRVTIK